MKKFQNVESRVSTGRPASGVNRNSASAAAAGGVGGIPRPPATGSSRMQQQSRPTQVAFGKATTVRSGSAQGVAANPRLPPSANKLTAANLSKLNGGRSGSTGAFKRPIDPDVQVFTGEEETKQEAAADA